MNQRLWRSPASSTGPVADPRDIAGMKVSAIASRGTKCDFVDLYFCAEQYGLKEILQMFDVESVNES
jgi:hypothetical protein